MSKPVITVDLSTPLNNHFEPSTSDNQNLLQIDAIEQINELIKTVHRQAQKPAPHSEDNQEYDFNPRRCNNTIFIHGERGAGKTTFLRAVINNYQKAGSEDNGNVIKISSIPLIDPTLVQTHQHILVEIITKFVRLMSNKLNCCSDEKKYQQFRDKLEKMAEGLKLLNISDHGKTGHSDAAWFLDRALNKATSGQDLELCLHQLLDTMSSILNTDLFLIAIDDVDTQTTKAYEVLEVLRCYLTHPKLVILISGDLKLYSHIVRNKKHAEINTQSGTNGNSDELIGHLEQQYLAKILPVEQRIELKNLSELSKKSTILVKINDKETQEICSLISEILSDSLNIADTHLNPHLQFLLNQPLRTVLQVIKVMLDTREDGLPFDSLTLKRTIQQSFMGNLLDEDLKTDSLSQPKPHVNTIGYELFKILSRHGEMETGFYARPDSSLDQIGYNAAKLYLSTIIASYSSPKDSFSNAIKFMLTCGASTNIYQTFVVNNQIKVDYADYIDYIGLNRHERDIISLAAHFSPILLHGYNPTGKNKAIVAGVIRTVRRMEGNKFQTLFDKLHINLEEKSGKAQKINNLSRLADGHIELTRNDKNIADFIAARTILFSSHSVATTAEGRDYISAYSFLAAIAEIADGKNLYNAFSTNTYVYPSFLKGNIKGNDNNLDDESTLTSSTSESGKDAELEAMIKKWRGIISESPISSLLIGKIWTRIHYNLSNISEESRKKLTYKDADQNDIMDDMVLGLLFARFTWSIINSALIEETRYSNKLTDIEVELISKAKNIGNTPGSLVHNIKSLVNGKVDFGKQLPFTYNLITCPLLWPFLGDGQEDEEGLFVNIKKIITDDEIESSFESVAKNVNPITLRISALPIMGCFK